MLRRILKWFDRKFSLIPTSFVNFATVVPFMISVVLWVLTWFNISDNSPINTYAILRFCADIRFIFIMLILLYFMHIKKEFDKERINDEIAGRNYYNALHEFRNKMGEFQVSIHKETATLESVQLLVKRLVKSILDNLCETYAAYSGEVISGCVTMLEPEDEAITLENARVQTFERSSHSDSARYMIDETGVMQKVSDNTDFYLIVTGELDNEKSVFYKSNLLDFEKRQEDAGHRYKNTNTAWKEHYKSTIVAPIRIANSRNPYNEVDKNYTILGFLCVDSKSVFAFPNDRQEYYTNIIKSYAALLYVVLEKYKEYLRNQVSNVQNIQHTQMKTNQQNISKKLINPNKKNKNKNRAI